MHLKLTGIVSKLFFFMKSNSRRSFNSVKVMFDKSLANIYGLNYTLSDARDKNEVS